MRAEVEAGTHQTPPRPSTCRQLRFTTRMRRSCLRRSLIIRSGAAVEASLNVHVLTVQVRRGNLAASLVLDP